MRLAVFAHSVEENGLGRAFCFWLMAKELNWDVEIVVPQSGEPWLPLGEEQAFLSTFVSDPIGAAERSDLLLALKPWPGSFDIALKAGRAVGRPVTLDVDDPDWENLYGWNLPRVLERFVNRGLHGDFPVHAYRLRWQASHTAPVLVSNPSLQRWYTGANVIPHVRTARPAGDVHSRTSGVEVAFVGSVRPHKGVELLREAVDRAGDIRLTITDDPPSSARPNESWTGITSLATGLELVDHADIVAVPSLPWMYGYQLPVKLIDAMMSGRAIVASDLPPIRWALGDTGLLVQPGDVDSLTRGLQKLRDPAERTRLGLLARARALKVFTAASVAPAFAALLSSVL
jgi:glycosyltransferase involved in cell wall biosynthesis